MVAIKKGCILRNRVQVEELEAIIKKTPGYSR
jgi:hypothetical protein